MREFRLFVCIVLLVSSCAREKSITSSRKLVFNARWAEVNETKTHIREDETSVWWNTYEYINVFYGSSLSGMFCSTNTTQQPVVSFEYRSGDLEDITEPNESQDYYWAVYPFDESNTCDGSSVTLSLPARQQAVAGTFSNKFFPAIARSKNTDLAFFNVCGGARFNVSEGGFVGLTITSLDSSPLAGKVKIGFSDNEKPSVIEVIEGIPFVSIEAPEGGFVPGKNYYVTMLPLSHDDGLSFKLLRDDGTIREHVIHRTVTVHRSMFGMLNDLDLGIHLDSEPNLYILEDSADGFRNSVLTDSTSFVIASKNGTYGLQCDTLLIQDKYTNESALIITDDYGFPSVVFSGEEIFLFDRNDNGNYDLLQYDNGGIRRMVRSSFVNPEQLNPSTRAPHFHLPERLAQIYQAFDDINRQTDQLRFVLDILNRIEALSNNPNFRLVQIGIGVFNLATDFLEIGISIGAIVLSPASTPWSLLHLLDGFNHAIEDGTALLDALSPPQERIDAYKEYYISRYNIQLIPLDPEDVGSTSATLRGRFSTSDTMNNEHGFLLWDPLNNSNYEIPSSDTSMYELVSSLSSGHVYQYWVYMRFTRNGISYHLLSDSSKEFQTHDAVDGAVDLGLSVLWASCNLGSTSPEEFGSYYAWGETLPKTLFTRENYVWYNDDFDVTKYDAVDNKTRLDLEDDAAHVTLGDKWRMPTENEWESLFGFTWTWTIQNGAEGYLIESDITGNSIFLPAAGFWSANYDKYATPQYTPVYSNLGWGYYWSSDRIKDNPYRAIHLVFHSGSYYCDDQYGWGRMSCGSIRPVYDYDLEP